MTEHIVDLHIHSHYSRATSKMMNIEDLYRWGKIKGLNIMGTGDFTYPEWFEELRKKLKPEDNGFFTLKKKYAKKQDKSLPKNLRDNPIHFVLTVEISNIYTRGGSGRRLHNLIIVPSFEKASELNSKLQKIGNLKADGRPILGLDSKDLLEITLEVNEDNLFIPAHIWTPWFAMFGSKSGFDSIEEAFGDLKEKIVAVETGLSSDPFMNWRLSELDNITLVSNSDAHSPQKLGREANIYKGDLDYQSLIEAIKKGNDDFVGTIEFFPQEGKYHFDGHRSCGVRLKPYETKEKNGVCPKCNKQLTVGVQYRVHELADRKEDYRPKNHKRVEYIIPLVEMIAEVEGVKSVGSKTVQGVYEKMYTELGDEFSILRKIPVEKIAEDGFSKMAYAIDKMRRGDVYIEPGYDGVYGVIKVFKDKKEMQKEAGGQLGLL